jgi:hypothetical protein
VNHEWHYIDQRLLENDDNKCEDTLEQAGADAQ